jgi:shikimate dehydrogenase
MHNAAFAALGLNWNYLAIPVPPDTLEASVYQLASSGYRGLNVTTPHKQSVIPLLDSIAANAQALGAVNTMVIGQHQGDKPDIAGYNTDDRGFIQALRHGGFESGSGGCAVIIGAGGAARAVVYALLEEGIGTVVILNRTVERAQALAWDLGQARAIVDKGCGLREQQATQAMETGHSRRLASPDLEPLPPGRFDKERVAALCLSTETLIESARSADLLVNTTTVGMWPHAAASIWPLDVPIPSHLAVCDLVYSPLETRLLCHARQSGALPISGLEMLVQQGALAFELWTGLAPSVQVMRAAAEAALKQRT